MHPIPANEALNNEPLYYSYLSFLFRFIPRLSSFSKLQTSLGEILSAPAILAVFLFLRKRQMFSKKIINLSPSHLKFFEEISRFFSYLVKTCRSWERKMAKYSGEEIWEIRASIYIALENIYPCLVFLSILLPGSEYSIPVEHPPDDPTVQFVSDWLVSLGLPSTNFFPLDKMCVIQANSIKYIYLHSLYAYIFYWTVQR